MRFDCIHCRKATTKPQSVKGAFLRMLTCLLEPVIECRVWNIVANAERVDGNSIGLTLGFVEEPQSFKIFFAKHNLSSFKFSTKVCERDMLGKTPILEAYLFTARAA